MTPKTAFNFLKPSLEQFTETEKQELCNLILDKPESLLKRKNTSPEESRLKRITDKKRKLLKTGLFKN